MNKRILVAGLVASFGYLVLGGCTDRAEALDVLSKQGYTEIETGGYGLLSCSKDDTVRTRFEATSPTGARVSGTVCGGLLFRSNTVRFD